MGRHADEGRLEALAEAIRGRPGLRAADLADYLNWHRSTVMRSLPALEERGVLLVEDGAGRLSHFGVKRET